MVLTHTHTTTTTKITPHTSIRGRHLEISRRFQGGTWVRIREIPLNVPNEKVNVLMRKYSDVVVEATHCTWRNTQIKTGDRTIEIKLATDILGGVRQPVVRSYIPLKVAHINCNCHA